MMEAVLSNADHPEYGVATIPLPIPRNQYDHCVSLLEALEIGGASEADCRLDSLDSAWPVLNRLVCTKVNLDELDYLAKRLDSFTVGEFSQFQAMAEKLNLASMKDLINLTFCCQQATVITDFTNLKEIGRDHYMNIHGGCASMEELEQLDGEETAILLIENNEGTITRYGVVYDNGMQLSQLYDGRHLPCYHYEADMTAVGISSRWEPENSRNVTWIYLPASKGQIERAMQRSGIADPKDMRLWIAESSFPEEVDAALDFRCDTYAACTKQQAEELIRGLREIAPYVVIDCSSYIANDILSAVALMEADSVLRLANCDLKSIGYLSSQLPLLRELHWDEDKQYKAASNIKPLQAADRIGQVLGSVAFQLPHSQELEEQYP